MKPLNISTKMANSYKLLYITILYWITHMLVTRGESDLDVSSPVNPVDSGGILSVYCHVGTIQDGHSVQIFRKTSGVIKPTLLSMDDTLLFDEDDHMFLAVRQLTDGTFVYLLSVMYATSSDGGLYQCKIIDPYENTKIAEGSVDISFVYFPETDDPVCEGNTELLEGARSTFTCSSDVGNPVVSLEWEQSGGSISGGMRTEKHTSNGRTQMDISVHATKNLNNIVFTCKLTSKAFPGRLSTCHIGPLSITPRSSSMTIPHDTTQKTELSIEGNSVSSETLVEKCKDQCDAVTSGGLFWIITTVISAIFAIVFCIIVIVLFAKYYHLSDIDHVAHRMPQHPTHGGVYDELTIHGGQLDRERCKMYMSLERAKAVDGYCPPQVSDER